MTSVGTMFLSEVEDFLDACDLTSLTSVRKLNDGHRSAESPSSGVTLCPKPKNTIHYPPEWLQGNSFDTEFYKSSARMFNAIYAQADEVFDTLGLDSTNTRWGSSTQKRQGENGQIFYQYMYKRKVPFGFNLTCNELVCTVSHWQWMASRSTTEKEIPKQL
ncbi:unnamed protein product [Phytophthora fragariaefolia]|uniref:Unnamed protein product n=1 Tax=Phytophthora fragariaefolia TaxID=1490495 RepID=A0A9W6YAI5_9STRA|nr:unnamed protein product [Phytophthora fragariaefolia]